MAGPLQRDCQLARQAEQLRRAIARRRDMLVKRQRRKFSRGRQAEIDRLGEEFRRVTELAVRTGAEDPKCDLT